VFPFANEKVNAAPLLSCCVLLPNNSCQNRHIVMGLLFKSVGTYCGSNCCVECVPVLKYVLPTITPAAATTTTTTTARCMLLYSGAWRTPRMWYDCLKRRCENQKWSTKKRKFSDNRNQCRVSYGQTKFVSVANHA
jgi:hypothetical protein